MCGGGSSVPVSASAPLRAAGTAGLTSVGNFGVAWRAQSEDVQARLRTAYDAVREPWCEDGVFAFDVECVSVEARVPRACEGKP